MSHILPFHKITSSPLPSSSLFLPLSPSLSLPLSLSFSPSHSLPLILSLPLTPSPPPPPPQVRAEVSLLHKLSHPHVIDFIGVVLKPLCFILEWACGGSLHSVLTKYRKVDGRVGPLVLQQATLQVYIHGHRHNSHAHVAYVYTS